jgi:hypothetical protein
LTVLQQSPGKVGIREDAKPITLSLEQVMKNTDAYLFVLTISLLLATPIIQAIQTLLAMRGRIVFPLLRVETGRQYSTVIKSAPNLDVIVCPHCASSFDRNIDLNHATFIQPREAL